MYSIVRAHILRNTINRNEYNFLQVFLFLLILYLLLRKEKTLPGQVETLTYAAHHDGKVIYQEVDPGVSMEKQIEEYVTEYGGELVKGNGTDINQCWFCEMIKL